VDSTEAYELGAKHGAKTGKALMFVVKTTAPFAKLTVLGFGVLVLVGAMYPEITKKGAK
jgi:hypothetical protein